MHVRSEQRRSIGDDGEPNSPVLESMIVGNYREMPGLSLHMAQAARLFGIRHATCQAVLDDLVQRGHLRRAADGQYRRGANA
jgi:hypothetical protein